MGEYGASMLQNCEKVMLMKFRLPLWYQFVRLWLKTGNREEGAPLVHVVAEMPSLPFLAGDSRIWTSTMASHVAGPISRFYLSPTARPAATATRTLVKLLSCC